MKKIDVSLWELTQADVEQLAAAGKNITVLEYNPAFRHYCLVRTEILVRNYIPEYIYLAFEEPRV